MFDKMNYRNIFYSFWIGVIIGFLSQINYKTTNNLSTLLASLIVSGILGLLIGGIIEFVTVLLPISIAKPKTYFFINNLIAIITTIIIIVIIKIFTKIEISNEDFKYLLVVAISVIAIVNSFDYIIYKRTNKKLKSYQDKRYKYSKNTTLRR